MRIENSFIPVRGVGEKTERKLWKAGVTHWDEFEHDVVGPTLSTRIETFIETASDRLERAQYGFFADCLPANSQWRLFENAGSDACYLDIETTGLSRHRDVVTTVSMHQGGSTETLVRGRDLTRQRLAERLADAPLLVTFNGRRFDVPFIEHAFDLDLQVPHMDLYSACRTVGLSGGLSDVERQFGIERDDPDISGRDAVRLWHEYERGDEAALETLVRYNQADTINLEPIARDVTSRLHDSVFGTVRRSGDET
ncbi:ribonuclease H-like domain-containing protein [Halovivax cerinus]|uniref:Ribonuclease H-like domain-containing protein n=1 Tax=Halovivax cerinus TaxID=1487865 RepID=A0ABD5NMR1_9EURY|nr:ribonuclease H-like domain-containing protein [Halovivax cerinus]